MSILALDLGRFNRPTHAVWFDPSTGETKRHRFTTNRAGLEEAVRLFPGSRVVFEIQPGAGPAADVLRSLGVGYRVGNTNEDSFRWKNRKSKTDARDALKLAKLEAVGDLHPVHVPEKSVREHASLQTERDGLVHDRTRVKNRIHALLESHWIEAPSRESLWSVAGLARLEVIKTEATARGSDLGGQLDRALRHLAHLNVLINEVTKRLDALAPARPEIERLQTLPGVGPRTAEALVVAIDQPARFRNGKQIGAYLGFVPRVYQSGDTLRHGRITKAGNRRLRALLVQAAWIAVDYDDHWKALFERFGGATKARRRIAIVAIARRLGIAAWALMRHGTTYQPERLTTATAPT
jgi:transposase